MSKLFAIVDLLGLARKGRAGAADRTAEVALFGLIVGAVTGWVSSRGLREIFVGSR